MDKIKQIFSGATKDGEEIRGSLSEDEKDEMFLDAFCTVTAPRPGVKGMIYLHPDPAAKQAKRAKRAPRTTVIHKSTFHAIVKNMVGSELNVRGDAMEMLHREAERYLQGVFEDAQVLCCLNGRKTVGLQDIRGVQVLAAPSFVEKAAVLRRDSAFGGDEDEDEDKENVEPVESAEAKAT